MTFTRIGDMAQRIVDKCGVGTNRNRVNGEMRDHRGYVVIVGRYICWHVLLPAKILRKKRRRTIIQTQSLYVGLDSGGKKKHLGANPSEPMFRDNCAWTSTPPPRIWLSHQKPWRRRHRTRVNNVTKGQSRSEPSTLTVFPSCSKYKCHFFWWQGRNLAHYITAKAPHGRSKY